MRLQRASIRFGLPLAVLALVGCGGTSDAAGAGDEVATLVDQETADEETTIADDAAVATTAPSAGELALELSQCLRDEGLDVADIGVDADGNIDLRSAFDAIDRSDGSFREAMDVCREILDGAEFGGGRRAQFDDPAVQDAFLEFSDCIRAQGFPDIPDLAVPGAGGPPPGQQDPQPAPDGGEGDGPPAGRGQRDGAFGDRGSRLADRLGLDPEDPDVVAAVDACLPIIDGALGGGPGDAGGDEASA